eukprot:16450146-Heterocapsa_arctica.AAC.1
MALEVRVAKAMELNRPDRETPNQSLIQKLDVAIKSLTVVADQMGETKRNAARSSSSGSGRPWTSRQVFEVVSSSRLWCELVHEQEAPCTSFS